jgi:hypothetical protein
MAELEDNDLVDSIYCFVALNAPTISTQKLKLMGKVGKFTYTPTPPLTCRLLQAAYVEYWSGL